MANSVPVKAYYFPLEAYPFRLEALHPETGAVVWSMVVETPGGMFHVPPLARQFGHRVKMRAIWADGSITEEP